MNSWDEWQSIWASASGPLPAVHARVSAEVRRHRRARVTVFALLAAASLAAIPAFAAPEELVHLIGWGILAFCAAMGIGYLVTHHDVADTGVTAPREALGFLERRLQAERRVAQLTRWVYLAACVLGAVATQLLYREHGSPLPTRVMTLGCFLFGLALTFTTPWWFGGIARRRQSEIDAWRRWLDEQNL